MAIFIQPDIHTFSRGRGKRKNRVYSYRKIVGIKQHSKGVALLESKEDVFLILSLFRHRRERRRPVIFCSSSFDPTPKGKERESRLFAHSPATLDLPLILTKGNKTRRRYCADTKRYLFNTPINLLMLQSFFPEPFREMDGKLTQELEKAKEEGRELTDNEKLALAEKCVKQHFNPIFRKMVNNVTINPTLFARKHKRIPRQLLRK